MSIWLIVLAIAMWISQMLLGLWQFRRFNLHLKEMRKEGRVAIGKAKGKFFAGAVTLLVIDKDATIIRGEVMKGHTVFAGFSPLSVDLSGINLTELTEDHCQGLTGNVKAAVLNARTEYENFMKRKIEDETKDETKSTAPDDNSRRLCIQGV